MKYISFKILFFCILLPPVLYVITVQSLERYLNTKYLREIEQIYIGDIDPLKGEVRLKDAVKRNIDNYISKDPLIQWGLSVDVKIVTQKGTSLYPGWFDVEQNSVLSLDPTGIARENFQLMEESPQIILDVKLEHNTMLSNAVLALYIILFLFGLSLYYRAGIQKAWEKEIEKDKKIDELMEHKTDLYNQMEKLEQQRDQLALDSETIKKDLETEHIQATRNEDEMFNEILNLEKKLEKNKASRNKQQEEIDELTERIKRYETRRKKESKSDALNKRFKTLYKNLSVADRAVSGFIDLTSDLQIKCEEIIHQLNENSDLVQIKRKVFGRKGMETILEVIFGYRGRLYFQKTKEKKITVLAVGTKNTQTKDLEFLSGLSSK